MRKNWKNSRQNAFHTNWNKIITAYSCQMHTTTLLQLSLKGMDADLWISIPNLLGRKERIISKMVTVPVLPLSPTSLLLLHSLAQLSVMSSKMIHSLHLPSFPDFLMPPATTTWELWDFWHYEPPSNHLLLDQKESFLLDWPARKINRCFPTSL